MRPRLPLVMLLLTIAAVPATSRAQTRGRHLGPQVAYNFDASAFGVGAQFSMPVAKELEFYPSFDFFFVSPGSVIALNADLKYRLADEGINWAYVGAGLDLQRASAGGAAMTTAGVNLFAGIESMKGSFHPFGEARLTIGDGSTAQIAGGLNFTIGRPLTRS